MIGYKLQKAIQFATKYSNVDVKFFLKGGFWFALRQFGGMFRGLVLSIILARFLTVTALGQYELVLSISATLSILSIPGLNASIVQAVAKGNDGDYPLAVKTSFKWSLIAIPILISIGCYYLLTGNSLGYSLIIISFLFPLVYSPNTWSAFLTVKEKFKEIAVFTLIESTICALAIFLVLMVSRQLIVLITLYFSLLAFFNVLWFWLSKRAMLNKQKSSDMLSYGYFLTKISIIQLVTANIDKLLIGFLIGPIQLAYYSIGINFSQRIFDISKNFLSIASSKISTKNTFSPKLYIFIFGLFSIISVIGILMMPFVLPLLYTNQYQSSVIFAQIFLAFLPFYVITSLLKAHITYFTRDKLVLLQESLLYPFFKVILYLIMIPLFGVVGLAFALGFQNALELLLLYILAKKKIKFLDKVFFKFFERK